MPPKNKKSTTVKAKNKSKPNKKEQKAGVRGAQSNEQLVDDDGDVMYNEGNETENEAQDEVGINENLDEIEDDDAFEDNVEVDDIEDEDDLAAEEDKEDYGETGKTGEEEGEDKGLKEDDERCFYKFGKKNGDEDEDEDIDNYEESFDDDKKIYDDIVKPEDRITKPVLSKYERVRLLGDRAKQLSLGAKPMLKNVEHLTPKEIAKLELEHKTMPLIIERPLPNGKRERWYLHELTSL